MSAATVKNFREILAAAKESGMFRFLGGREERIWSKEGCDVIDIAAIARNVDIFSFDDEGNVLIPSFSPVMIGVPSEAMPSDGPPRFVPGPRIQVLRGQHKIDFLRYVGYPPEPEY